MSLGRGAPPQSTKSSTSPFVPCSSAAQLAGSAYGAPNGLHGAPQCHSPPKNSNAVMCACPSIVPSTSAIGAGTSERWTGRVHLRLRVGGAATGPSERHGELVSGLQVGERETVGGAAAYAPFRGAGRRARRCERVVASGQVVGARVVEQVDTERCRLHPEWAGGRGERATRARPQCVAAVRQRVAGELRWRSRDPARDGSRGRAAERRADRGEHRGGDEQNAPSPHSAAIMKERTA